jgi:CheY-like chemotaxis protein
VRARLFEPFFTTKPTGQGTGLGLATVLGIALECGAGIEVESEIGRGTTFTIHFPCTAGPSAQVQPSAAVAPRPAAHHVVLVVDDAEGIRELARRLLGRRGYEVVTAANADEAVRLFAANPAIDLVLTDVVMPGASGPELMVRLLRDRPSLRVVYMSGYNQEIVDRHGISKASIAFLHKPFNSDTLDAAIREVLGEAPTLTRAG